MTDKPTVTQADIDAMKKAGAAWNWDHHKAAYAIIAAHREAAVKEARELLENLAARENAYRKVHDLVGAEHWETEKARLLMQYAGDAARALLTSAKGSTDE